MTDLFLFLRCRAQVRRLSNVNPRFVTVEVVGVIILLNETGGGKLFGRNEEVIKDDLASLIFVFHCLYRKYVLFNVNNICLM